MDRSEIARCVMSALAETAMEAETARITESTDPMQHLGLSSEDGLDFACTLSTKLGFEIDHNVNPFVDDERNRPRDVSDIILLVGRLLPAQKELING